LLRISEFEQNLLEACYSGEPATISATRPAEATRQNIIRADFIRFLALGGDDQNPVHKHGVQMMGAWIEEQLDLSFGKTSSLFFSNYHFNQEPIFLDTEIGGQLSLSGGTFHVDKGNALVADGIKTPINSIDLTSAKVSVLVDELDA